MLVGPTATELGAGSGLSYNAIVEKKIALRRKGSSKQVDYELETKNSISMTRMNKGSV